MPDYTEEIYERAENKFSSDSAKLAWLRGFKSRPQNSFTKAGGRLADEFVAADNLNSRLRSTNDLDEVEDIMNKSGDLRHYGDNIYSDAKFKFSRLEELEIERQEQEIAEEEAIKQEAKERIKESVELEEQKEARRELREVSPKAYAQVKSVESRRAKTALKYIVG